MRNVIYLGMCWVMSLGVVAVALGQQQSEKVGRNGPATAPQTIDTTGMPLENAMQPPQRQDRSMLTGNGSYQSEVAAHDDGQRRGELGVWMGETGGPRVRVLRITGGSAAEQAGLRAGDVILQVNGQGASSPHDTAALIRKIAVGEKGRLTVWRDGNQQELQVMMQPVRQVARQTKETASHEASIGHSDSANSDLASRTARLEQQINALTQELASLRQEMAQLRTTGPVQTGFTADANQSTPPQPPQDRYLPGTTKAPAPGPANAAPPPGFGAPEEKPAQPPADAAKSPAPPAPAPAAEKSSSNDVFGADSAKPKSEEKPKAGKGGTDDLFK